MTLLSGITRLTDTIAVLPFWSFFTSIEDCNNLYFYLICVILIYRFIYYFYLLFICYCLFSNITRYKKLKMSLLILSSLVNGSFVINWDVSGILYAEKFNRFLFEKRKIYFLSETIALWIYYRLEWIFYHVFNAFCTTHRTHDHLCRLSLQNLSYNVEWL